MVYMVYIIYIYGIYDDHWYKYYDSIYSISELCYDGMYNMSVNLKIPQLVSSQTEAKDRRNN